VQGFGNVGAVAARLLWREGCTIVGISDVKGGIWKPDGIDIRQLEAHVAETGTVAGFPGSEPISNSDLIIQPCDVLIPAAVGGQIHESNADRVKASIIAEGANGPTTPEADVILRERGVTVIPTSSATPAVWSSPISSGCRGFSTTSGARARSSRGCRRS